MKLPIGHLAGRLLHDVDVTLDEPRYDARFSGPDPRKGCVVDKLMEFVNILGNPARPVEERCVALRFVIHLVGDLHQPLHVGDNGDRDHHPPHREA